MNDNLLMSVHVGEKEEAHIGLAIGDVTVSPSFPAGHIVLRPGEELVISRDGHVVSVFRAVAAPTPTNH